VGAAPWQAVEGVIGIGFNRRDLSQRRQESRPRTTLRAGFEMFVGEHVIPSRFATPTAV
jgi:hypothetical protein